MPGAGALRGHMSSFNTAVLLFAVLGGLGPILQMGN